MAVAAVKIGAVGGWKTCVNKAFVGNRGILHGNPNILACTGGAPTGAAVPAAVGTLAVNLTAGDWYICTVKDTTWVKINA